MIPKSGRRFSEKIMQPKSMIPKSGRRFSEKIMQPKSMIPKSGRRFSEKIMRPKSMIPKSRLIGARRFAAVALLMPLIATVAGAAENPGDCLGVGFEVTHPVTIAKIIADRPQVHFIKNASDEPACPAERDACAAPSYLIPGDLVLVGKTRGAYSCVSYQSAADRTQRWTVGWLPSASLTPVQPAR